MPIHIPQAKSVEVLEQPTEAQLHLMADELLTGLATTIIHEIADEQVFFVEDEDLQAVVSSELNQNIHFHTEETLIQEEVVDCPALVVNDKVFHEIHDSQQCIEKDQRSILNPSCNLQINQDFNYQLPQWERIESEHTDATNVLKKTNYISKQANIEIEHIVATNALEHSYNTLGDGGQRNGGTSF